MKEECRKRFSKSRSRGAPEFVVFTHLYSTIFGLVVEQGRMLVEYEIRHIVNSITVSSYFLLLSLVLMKSVLIDNSLVSF